MKSDKVQTPKRNVQILPPEEFSTLKLGNRKKKAAGLPSILSTVKHVNQELGVAKGVKLLRKMNQKEGFDCPGCAWPDPDEKRSSLGEFCENGAKAISEEASSKRIGPDFFQTHDVETLSTWTDYDIGKAGRLTQPMYLPAGKIHYEPISWEGAFRLIGEKLKTLEDPNQAIFYTSGRTSNEAAFMYQLFARQFGTNNLPDCSNMCHESSGVALGETLGIGKGSVTLEDLHQAEVIVVMGQNPGTNHPRMLSALAKCKKNGGTIVSLNPIPEAGNQRFVDPQSPASILRGGQPLTDLYLQVAVNGDLALLKATLYLLYQAELQQPGQIFDLDFIAAHTEHYEAFIAEIEQLNFSKAVAASGVPESEIRAFADLLSKNKRIIICWAMGITQHVNGVDTIKEIVNLLLVKGSVGIPGGGTCPVRGHSNVQGDRTMGIWEKPKEAFLQRLDQHFGMSCPREHGVDAVSAIKAMYEGKIRVFMALGGNFVSATPDSLYTGQALQNCELTIQVSTKLNRSHLVTGTEALILPCISRSELDVQASGPQFVTVENSMGVVHKSKGFFQPASSELLSEHAIVAGIAGQALANNSVDWEAMVKDYAVVRDHIAATIPGFEDYNEKVKDPAGFYLPNGARAQQFNTASGKAQFTVTSIPANEVAEGNLIMMTVRTHDQFNTTIYGMDDRYRGIYNERRVVLMHKDDITAQQLQPSDIVHLKSVYQGEERVARNFKVVPYEIARGCVATYFPEANVLVPIDRVARKSNTPVSKFVEIQMEKA